MRGKTGIAVAGTHGKTTTTSMLATILTVAGLDPTIVIGGKVDSLGGNAKLGQGPLVVAEADESDGSFLQLPATYAIVTNVDNDHLDHFQNLGAIDDAFVNFVGKIPFYGAVAVCAEDGGVKRNLARFTKPFVTYGMSALCDIYASEVKLEGMGSTYRVHARASAAEGHEALGTFRLNVPGEHNVLNSLAAITIARQLEVPVEKMRAALAEFRGVKRRFEVRWKDEATKRAIVDDYGHHPTEVAATLLAARRYWSGGRVIAVFQPHRYSRTVHCRDAFLGAFRDADVLLMTDIYAAGEEPIEGVTAESLTADIHRANGGRGIVEYVGDLANARARVLKLFQPGDLVMCLGAGSITKLPDELVKGLV